MIFVERVPWQKLNVGWLGKLVFLYIGKKLTYSDLFTLLILTEIIIGNIFTNVAEPKYSKCVLIPVRDVSIVLLNLIQPILTCPV